MNIVQREYDKDALIDVIDDPILRKIASSRGIKNACELNLSLDNMLHYKDLKDIDKAAAIICKAIIEQKHICIMGDYDVDGMTGTALGVLVLKDFGAKNVSYQVPSRYNTGYGLAKCMIDKARENNVDLIVTVDNGISCFDEVEYANELGIKVIITDHHKVSDSLPKACAIVNPKQQEDNFASKNLSGVGVLFYTLLATRAYLQKSGYFADNIPPNMLQYLDLVAIGTIGDVVTLDNNNRLLVKLGLQRIQSNQLKSGLRALFNIALNSKPLQSVNSTSISYLICSRLNSCSRINIEDNPSLQILMCTDDNQAQILAKRIEYCNKRRGDFERVFLQEALDIIKQNELDKNEAIVIYKENWLTGFSGLIASRIKDKYHKPVFVFAKDNDMLTGSSRSVSGLSLFNLLTDFDKQNPNILQRFGGHDMAAGCSIKKEHFELFKDLLEKQLKSISKENLDQIIYTDGSLPLSYINIDFINKLNSLGPFGSGFAEPLFEGEFILESIYHINKACAVFTISNQEGSIKAIKYIAQDEMLDMHQGDRVYLVYTIGLDYKRNQVYANMKIKNIIKLDELCPHNT